MSELQDTENKINKLAEDFFFEGIVEPEYKEIKCEEDEYDCLNTIKKFYDENKVLRKEIVIDKNEYVLDIALYDKNGEIILKGAKAITDDIKTYEIEKETKSNGHKVYESLIVSISTGEIISREKETD